jgi:hypothetical protein
MLRLRAVEPYGLCVHDADRVSEDLGSCSDGSVGRHESREKGGSHVGHDILNRYARLVEGRLDYGVVLGTTLGQQSHNRVQMSIPWGGTETV